MNRPHLERIHAPCHRISMTASTPPDPLTPILHGNQFPCAVKSDTGACAKVSGSNGTVVITPARISIAQHHRETGGSNPLRFVFVTGISGTVRTVPVLAGSVLPGAVE